MPLWARTGMFMTDWMWRFHPPDQGLVQPFAKAPARGAKVAVHVYERCHGPFTTDGCWTVKRARQRVGFPFQVGATRPERSRTPSDNGRLSEVIGFLSRARTHNFLKFAIPLPTSTFPRKRTFLGAFPMSAKGQQRTLAFKKNRRGDLMSRA